ncbi:MAG TPA: hypothetical protein PL033_18090 [Candidatus Brocadiia bacterium]|nr:hypothetical protein [Candidatus Brocadiia bacterium]
MTGKPSCSFRPRRGRDPDGYDGESSFVARILGLFPALIEALLRLVENSWTGLSRWLSWRRERRIERMAAMSRTSEIDEDAAPAAPGLSLERAQRIAGRMERWVNRFFFAAAERRRAASLEKTDRVPGILSNLTDAVFNFLTAPLLDTESKVNANQIAQLVVAWAGILFLPALAIGVAFVREFPTSEDRIIKGELARRSADVARNIYETGRFSTNIIKPIDMYFIKSGGGDAAGSEIMIRNHPDLATAPLYPMALSTLFAFTGVKESVIPFAGGAFWLVSAWLTYYLALKWRNRFAAGMALAFYSVSYFAARAAFSGSPAIFTSVFFVLYMCMYADCFISKSRDSESGKSEELILPHPIHFFFLGICGGLVCLCSWPMAFIVLPTAVWLLASENSGFRTHRAAMAGGLLLTLLPWPARNALISGHPGLITLWKYELLNGAFGNRDAFFRSSSPVSDSVLAQLFGSAPDHLERMFLNLSQILSGAGMWSVLFWGGALVLCLAAAFMLTGELGTGKYRGFFFPFTIGIAGFIFQQGLTMGDPIEGAALLPFMALAAGQVVGLSLSRGVLATDKAEEEAEVSRQKGFFHALWNNPMAGPAFRYGIAAILVLMGAIPLLSRQISVTRQRVDVDKMDKLKQKLNMRNNIFIFSDEPDLTAWALKAPCIDMPLLESDVNEWLAAAEKEKIEFGGFYLARTADSLAGYGGAQEWLRSLYHTGKYMFGTHVAIVMGGGFMLRLPGPEVQYELMVSVSAAGDPKRLITAGKGALSATRDVILETGNGLKKGNIEPVLSNMARPLLMNDIGRWAFLTTAHVMLAGGKHEAAAMLLRPLVLANRNDKAVLCAISILFYQTGRKEKAQTVLKEACRNGLPKVSIHTLARAVSGAGTDEEAALLAQLVIGRRLAANAPYPLAYVAAMDLLHQYDIRESTLRLAESIIKVFPNERDVIKRARLVMAEVMLKQGRSGDALLILEALLNEYPEFDMAMINYGLCCQSLGRFEEAERAMREWARREQSRKIVLIRLLSEMYAAKGDLRAAVTFTRQGLSYNPEDVILLNNLAYYLCDMAQYEEAERLARIARQYSPGSPAIADTLAWILYKTGKHAEAARVLDPVAGLSYQYPVMAYHCGIIFHAAGRYEDAQRYLELCISNAKTRESWAQSAQRTLEEVRKVLEAKKTGK